MTYKCIQGGAAGVDMGRNIFQSTHPVQMAQAVHQVVHDGLTGEQGYELFQTLVSENK